MWDMIWLAYYTRSSNISNRLVLPMSVADFDTVESNLACGNVERWFWASWRIWTFSSNTACLLWLSDSGWMLDCGGIAWSSFFVCEQWHRSCSLFSVPFYSVSWVWSKRSHCPLHSLYQEVSLYQMLLILGCKPCCMMCWVQVLWVAWVLMVDLVVDY